MIKPKVIPLLEMCIENGVRLGYSRAFKHNDHPSEEEIFLQIENAVMNEIYEWFNLEEDRLS